MEVAVIIPVFNAEKWVNEAVSSIVNEDYVCEVILAEDGSTDNSMSVCEQLCKASPKVRVFRHLGGGNRGPGASRNLGVRHAQSDLVAFLDADDFCLPDRFGLPVKILVENPEIDGVYEAVGTIFEDEGTKKRWDTLGWGDLTTVRKVLDPRELFYYLVMWEAGHFHLNGLVMRRRTFQQVGGFNESLRIGEDTHFCIRLSASGNFVPGRLSQAVALRRVHSDNWFVAKRDVVLESRLLMWKSLNAWARNSNQTRARRIIVRHRLWKAMERYYYNKQEYPTAILYFVVTRLIRLGIRLQRRILGARSF